MQRNRFEVAGYLATKPSVRRLPSGTPVANVRLGETYRYQDADRKSQQQTNWHSLSFYGDLSRVALTFEKGDNIFVEGTIEQRQFTPKSDGAQRTVHEVVVRNCHLIAAPRPPHTKAAVATMSEEPVPDLQGGAIEHADWPVG
jgi:single-strand DNA-binding protein